MTKSIKQEHSKPASPSSPSSPCVGSCAVSAQAGFCIGCGRKLKEIATWQNMSADEKRAVLAELPARLASIP